MIETASRPGRKRKTGFHAGEIATSFGTVEKDEDSCVYRERRIKLPPEIGWAPIRVDKENELLGPAGTPYTFSIHYDEVRDLPAPFEILASTDACPVQAFRLGGQPVWGLQGHPEVDIPTGRRFLHDLVERGFKGRDFLLEALRQPPRDSGLILRIVRAFLAAGRLQGEKPRIRSTPPTPFF